MADNITLEATVTPGQKVRSHDMGSDIHQELMTIRAGRSPTLSYQTSSGLTAGSSVALTSAAADGKTLTGVDVWSSVPFKATLHTVDNSSESAVRAVGGSPGFTPWVYRPPGAGYTVLGTTGGTDAFRVNVTNLDAGQAADVHATFYYED